MNYQVITNIVERFAELHVEYLKMGKGASLMAYLAKMESAHKEDWRTLAATEAAVLSAVCKRILDELDEND